ncbi:hypothetical protein [Nitriliruptor alkaliphilus]|uniref:hypothetical protein n=1 Tax=Nitriliruptor alkaliphilus TaxID=427918 RepID=UPI000698F9A2|nr:hypothetical protein [Nitriliruptor alkaliphilus]
MSDDAPGGTTGAPAEPPRRTLTVVAAELADVERYLTEVPPHSGGGRATLERRRAILQRELTALRDEAARD